MNKKAKLLFSLMSLCFSIAMLVFGVYSAMSVSYSITGSVSYQVNDVFVKIDLSVYKSTSESPLEAGVHKSNVTTIQNAQSLPATGTELVEGIEDSVKTYDETTGEVINPGEILEDKYEGLNLVYGLPNEQDNNAWAFYVVLDITNYGQEILNAKVTNTTTGDTQNTYFEQTKAANIPAKTDGAYGKARLVLGLAVSDVTKGASGDFSYTIKIERGELEESVEVTGLRINGESQSITPFELSEKGSATSSSSLPNIQVQIPVATDTMYGRSEVEMDVSPTFLMSPYAKMFVTNNSTNSSVKVNASSAYIQGEGVYKIYLDNTSTTSSQTINLNEISISYDKEDKLMHYDENKNYYYIEMGTYMPSGQKTNEYIRWRYLTSNLTGENAYAEATLPNDITSLSDLTGMYIQETYVDEATNNVSWENSYISERDDYHTETGLEKVKANEYRASNIRKYLNLTNGDAVYKNYNQDRPTTGKVVYSPVGMRSNLCHDLNIDVDNDIVYKQITARPLTNDEATGLYDNMKNGPSGGKIECDTSYDVPDEKGGILDDKDFDKFWLPSFYEMYKLFTNDSGANTTKSCPSREWLTQSGSAVSYYWLRSPDNIYNLAWGVTSSGYLNSAGMCYSYACRPAFQIV